MRTLNYRPRRDDERDSKPTRYEREEFIAGLILFGVLIAVMLIGRR